MNRLFVLSPANCNDLRDRSVESAKARLQLNYYCFDEKHAAILGGFCLPAIIPGEYKCQKPRFGPVDLPA